MNSTEDERPALTPSQTAVVRFIRRYRQSKLLSPSFQDMATEFGWSSRNTARTYLVILERKGYVRLTFNTTRSAVLINADGSLERTVPVIQASLCMCGDATFGVPCWHWSQRLPDMRRAE